jgi:hypothetical protein
MKYTGGMKMTQPKTAVISPLNLYEWQPQSDSAD